MASGLRSTCGHAVADEASSHQEATSAPQTQQARPTPSVSLQAVLPMPSVPVIQPALVAQPQVDVVSQILPTLVAIHNLSNNMFESKHCQFLS